MREIVDVDLFLKLKNKLRDYCSMGNIFWGNLWFGLDNVCLVFVFVGYVKRRKKYLINLDLKKLSSWLILINFFNLSGIVLYFFVRI